MSGVRSGPQTAITMFWFVNYRPSNRGGDVLESSQDVRGWTDLYFSLLMLQCVTDYGFQFVYVSLIAFEWQLETHTKGRWAGRDGIHAARQFHSFVCFNIHRVYMYMQMRKKCGELRRTNRNSSSFSDENSPKYTHKARHRSDPKILFRRNFERLSSEHRKQAERSIGKWALNEKIIGCVNICRTNQFPSMTWILKSLQILSVLLFLQNVIFVCWLWKNNMGICYSILQNDFRRTSTVGVFCGMSRKQIGLVFTRTGCWFFLRWIIHWFSPDLLIKSTKLRYHSQNFEMEWFRHYPNRALSSHKYPKTNFRKLQTIKCTSSHGQPKPHWKLTSSAQIDTEGNFEFSSSAPEFYERFHFHCLISSSGKACLAFNVCVVHRNVCKWRSNYENTAKTSDRT